MGLLTGGGGLGGSSGSGFGGVNWSSFRTPTRRPASSGPIDYTNAPLQGPSATHPGPISMYPFGYAEAEKAAQGYYEGDKALNDQILLSLGQERALSGAVTQNNVASTNLDTAYANQQKGFANVGADLARQILGIDLSDVGIKKKILGINKEDVGINKNILGIDRQDFNRANALDKWRMQQEHAARGAFVTPGHRYQQGDLAQQLSLGNRRFDQQGYLLDNEGRRIDQQGYLLDNEGKRIGVRGEQVDLNLSEQLAGYDNRIGQNAISAKDAADQQALQNLGYDRQTAEALVNIGKTDRDTAILIGQILAGQNNG